MPGVQLRVEPNGFGIALHDQCDSLSDKATRLHFAVRVTLLASVFRQPHKQSRYLSWRPDYKVYGSATNNRGSK